MKDGLQPCLFFCIDNEVRMTELDCVETSSRELPPQGLCSLFLDIVAPNMRLEVFLTDFGGYCLQRPCLGRGAVISACMIIWP